MDADGLREAAGLADPVERAQALTAFIVRQQQLCEEAARYRRHAIAELRQQGMTLEQIGDALGVTPGRVSQMRKGAAQPYAL